MSHRALGRQWEDIDPTKPVEQLAMFMPTSEVVNEVHKIDSSKPHWSPADQWSKPGEQGFSLKDIKLAETRSSHRVVADLVKQDQDKPLAIYSPGPGEPKTLADGHHRLAVHENLGHQWIPVTHRDKRVWGSSYES